VIISTWTGSVDYLGHNWVRRGAMEVHVLVKKSGGVGSGAMRVARSRYFAAVHRSLHSDPAGTAPPCYGRCGAVADCLPPLLSDRVTKIIDCLQLSPLVRPDDHHVQH
jgi:hypothetical protein